MHKEDYEYEPESAVERLTVCLVDKSALFEVSDLLRQMMQFDLRCIEDQDETAAQTCTRGQALWLMEIYNWVLRTLIAHTLIVLLIIYSKLDVILCHFFCPNLLSKQS